MSREMEYIEWAAACRALAVSQALFLIFSTRIAFPQKKPLLASASFVVCFASYCLLFMVAPDWPLFNLLLGLNLATPLAAYGFIQLITESAAAEKSIIRNYLIGFFGFALIFAYCFTDLRQSPLFRNCLIGWNTVLVMMCASTLWIGYRGDLNRVRTVLRLVLSFGFIVYVAVVGVVSSLRPFDAGEHNLLRAVEGSLLAALGIMMNAILVYPPFFSAAFLVDASVPGQSSSLARQVKELESLSEKVRHLMEKDQLFLEQGLSLPDLANKLEVPVYRVRFLLNQHLGHENFSSFVNPYRLEFAAALLTQPSKSTEKIFAIALQSGFSSLAPFNKAFKARYGVTPSDYRESNLNRAKDHSN